MAVWWLWLHVLEGIGNSSAAVTLLNGMVGEKETTDHGWYSDLLRPISHMFHHALSLCPLKVNRPQNGRELSYERQGRANTGCGEHLDLAS